MRSKKCSPVWNFPSNNGGGHWKNFSYAERMQVNKEIFMAECRGSRDHIRFKEMKYNNRSHSRGDNVVVPNSRGWKSVRFSDKSNYEIFKKALKPDVLPDIFQSPSQTLCLEWNYPDPLDEKNYQHLEEEDIPSTTSLVTETRAKSKVPIRIGSSLNNKSNCIQKSSEGSDSSLKDDTTNHDDSSERENGSSFCVSDSEVIHERTSDYKITTISSEPPPATLRGILKKPLPAKAQKSDETNMRNKNLQVDLKRRQSKPNCENARHRRAAHLKSKTSQNKLKPTKKNPPAANNQIRLTGLFAKDKSSNEKGSGEHQTSKSHLRKGLFADCLPKGDQPNSKKDNRDADDGNTTVKQNLSFKKPVSFHFINEKTQKEENVLFYNDKTLKKLTESTIQTKAQTLQKIAKYAKNYKMANLRGVYNFNSLAPQFTANYSQKEFKFRRHFHKCYNVLHIPKLDLRSTLKRGDVFAKEKKKVEHLVSPKFLRMFRIFATGKNSYNCGIAISKTKSYSWQKAAGLYNNMLTPEYADEAFILHCGIKCVMNVYDYMYYLVRMARQQCIPIITVLDMMNNCFVQLPQHKHLRRARSLPPRILRRQKRRFKVRASSQPPPWKF